MRVKRLELFGFKSFKDKTVIHFDEGVTGVVGPNGCGKSNLVDAFFWVMGEQSTKHMRADGQQDLIFNGSDKHPALSMAEVTLVMSTGALSLDSVGFAGSKSSGDLPSGANARDLPIHLRSEEVTITRRLFRDSTSEFFINRQPCRLKDIHELFMDTGAGPKAYSIVEQGQIAKIISSKPEDRRVLIEEAAGVIKFKARKKESLRKIEASEQNLLRLQDIIAEIERQLNSLEKQATKARQYRKNKEELKQKELLLGRKKLQELKGKLLVVEKQYLENKQKQEILEAHLVESELQDETLKLEHAQVQSVVEDFQSHLQAAQLEQAKAEGRQQLEKQRLLEIEQFLSSLKEDSEKLAVEVSELQNIKQDYESNADKLKNDFENAQKLYQEQELGFKAKKQKLEDLKTSIESSQTNFLKLLAEQKEFSNQIHTLQATEEAFVLQLERSSQKITQQEKEVQDLDVGLHEKENLLQALTPQKESCVAELENLQNECSNLEEKIKKLQSQDAYLSERLDSIRNAEQVLQTLQTSPLVNSEWIKQVSEIRGAFTDLIEVLPEDTASLEGAFDPLFNKLNIQDRESTKHFLSEVKQKDLGKMFLWIRLFSKNTQLRKLSEEYEACSKEHNAVQQNLQSALLEKERIQKLLQTLQLKLKELEGCVLNLQREIELQKTLYEKAQYLLEQQRAELLFQSQSKEKQGVQSHILKQECAQKEVFIEQEKQKVEFWSKEHRLLGNEFEILNEELMQAKVVYTKGQEQYTFAVQNLERVNSECVQKEKKLERAVELSKQKQSEGLHCEHEKVRLDEVLLKKISEIQKLEADLNLKREELSKLILKLNVQVDHERVLKKDISDLTAVLNSYTLEKERIEMESQIFHESLFQKHEIEKHQIDPQNSEEEKSFSEISPEKVLELELEVQKLNEKIRRLGEVNVMAVEEYDEQKTRHDFLVAQREDLLKSIQDLHRAIEKINQTSEQRLKITFEEMNLRFERIFPIVFGGGWGKLVLTNPFDLSETGVDIIAEPPGKKVSAIQLMSGGEKALTAVALLFSVFLIKPSPFCILDEVDAPLDDHNVTKFNALLKEMSRKSQFIIITHNKRTMELNNKLYGVTMEEPGISKMVSIQIQ